MTPVTFLRSLSCRLFHRHAIIPTPWHVWVKCLDCYRVQCLGPVCPEGSNRLARRSRDAV